MNSHAHAVIIIPQPLFVYSLYEAPMTFTLAYPLLSNFRQKLSSITMPFPVW